MATIAKNAVGQYAAFTDTGVVTLSGAALEGGRTFSVYADGTSGIPVMLQEMDADGARGFPVAWELVQCTYNSTAGTLTRGTIYASSNSGSAVSFGAGIKRAFVVLVADDVATPADLSAGLAGKANTSHTHPLSAITQSSATTGQVPTWSGSAWVPATPSASGATHDDWIAGVEMYQDALATTPVTAQGQRLRAWRSPTGRTLLATESGGMAVALIDGVLTPHANPIISETGGLYLSGGIGAASGVHMILRSAAGHSPNAWVTDAPARTCESGAYNTVRTYVYNGSAQVFGTTYGSLANQTLLSFAHGHASIDAYRDGSLIVTVAGAGYTFPLAMNLLKSGAETGKGAVFLDRVRISPIAAINADMIELQRSVRQKPARKVAVISDSVFSASTIGAGVNNMLAEHFSVLAVTQPSAVLSTIIDADSHTQIALFAPEVLIYEITNDFAAGRTAAQLYADILASAAAIGISQIIVVTPWVRTAPWSDAGGRAAFTAECVAFDALCKASALVYRVSGYELITGPALAVDGVHFAPIGSEIAAAAVVTAVNEIRKGAQATAVYTVATLPASPRIGDRRRVSDALTPAYNATVVGGGARLVDVKWDNANWICS